MQASILLTLLGVLRRCSTTIHLQQLETVLWLDGRDSLQRGGCRVNVQVEGFPPMFCTAWQDIALDNCRGVSML